MAKNINQDETTDLEQTQLAPEGDYPIEIDNLTMNANVQGSNNPNAQVVVLLPGSGVMAPAQDFKLLIDELRGDCRVITIEPFGTGQSSEPDGEQPAQTADDIFKVLEALKSKQPSVISQDANYTVVAHSKSGSAGQSLAIQHPEIIDGFVGIDAYLPGQDEFLAKKYRGRIPDFNPKIDRKSAERKDKIRFPANVPTIFVAPSYLEEEPEKGGAPKLIHWRVERLTAAPGSRMLFAGQEHFAHHDNPAAIAEAIRSLKRDKANQQPNTAA
jgi:pimeloyl-ACP methyl ester carboxylesterase